MAKIGIVILNYITWKETVNCIKSIKKLKSKNTINIYVVDNGSPDKKELINICNSLGVKLIENERNVGYSAGNNIGVKQALKDTCDYIIISNNDIIFNDNSIDILCDFLSNNTEYGIVTPKILDKKSKVQRCHFIKEVTYKDIWNTQTILRYFRRKHVECLYGTNGFYLEKHEIFAASGCCFMMSKECATVVTPFDEKTFLYEEESIIGQKMKELSWKTAYVPDVSVIHNHNQTGKLVKPFTLTCWSCSEIYYCYEYLNLSKNKVRFLYWYRIMIFLLHSVLNKDFRNYLKDFFSVTRKYYNKEW